MNRLQHIANNVSDWGGVKSPSFKSFARKFKNDFVKELAKVNCKITGFNTGHYYISGFFRDQDDNCFYFSISDVRHFGFGKMLYRTAKDENDFTGGHNQYFDIETDMIHYMNLNN